MSAHENAKPMVTDIFVKGAVQGWQIAVTSTIPNVLMAFVIIKILDHSGLLKLIGTALDPIMGIFGLPGHDIAILAPSIYLMGSQVQYMGRCLGVIGIKGSRIPLIMAMPIITAIVSLWVMNVLVG